jgi:hypothetical protein
VEALAVAFGNADVIVFSAGTEGDSKEATKAIDDDGAAKTIEAPRRAGVDCLALVSVIPEGWRERNLGYEVEYYLGSLVRYDY